MTIEILYFAGCPNHEQLVKRLRTLLSVARITTKPILHEITTQRDAEHERFLGSPTLRVNGHDVEPAADDRTDYGMKCRVYRTPEGLTGLPTDRWILAAIAPDPKRAPLRHGLPHHDFDRANRPAVGPSSAQTPGPTPHRAAPS